MFPLINLGLKYGYIAICSMPVGGSWPHMGLDLFWWLRHFG